MATEEEKKKQLVKVLSLMVGGLAKGIYDLFEDSAYALMKSVGVEILDVMEKEMGLEISGEEPGDVLNELLRIWTDEIGMFEDAKVAESAEGWTVTGNNCKGWNLTQRILASGVKEPFTCPIMPSPPPPISRIHPSSHSKSSISILCFSMK